jgi:hypothetical protein
MIKIVTLFQGLYLVGHLPAISEGYMYLLNAIDRSARWVEVVPLRNMEASTCTDASRWPAPIDGFWLASASSWCDCSTHGSPDPASCA